MEKMMNPVTTLHRLAPRNRLRRLLVLAVTAISSLTLAAPAFAEEPIDTELDKYWNVDQKVESLQNPLYERKGGFEGELHFGLVPNDSFYLPKVLGARVNYFFTDTLSAEIGFSYLLNSNSDLQSFLTAAGASKKDLTQGAHKSPTMNWLSSADIAWAPFHGKIGIFASKLSNFDLSFNGGVGIIGANVDESDDGEQPTVSKVKVGGHWGSTLRVYLTRWMNVRLDYRQFLYFPTKDASFLAPVEFTIGLAFLTK